MKKTIIAFLGILLLFGAKTTSNAKENYVPMKCVDINELSTLPYEETYSYEEVLVDMEYNNLISKESVNAFKENYSKMSINQKEEIRYATFYMDSYTFKDPYIIGAKTYVLEPRIYVGLVYVGNSNTPSYIDNIDAPFIYTGGGADCKFAGNIVYKLEAGNRFFMGINGDVYQTATISTKVGIKAKVGTESSISYEVTSSNNYLKNVAWDTRFESAGMIP